MYYRKVSIFAFKCLLSCRIGNSHRARLKLDDCFRLTRPRYPSTCSLTIIREETSHLSSSFRNDFPLTLTVARQHNGAFDLCKHDSMYGLADSYVRNS